MSLPPRAADSATDPLTFAPQTDRMTRLELRAGASLASLFALRMLGLFLILPVFAVHASTLPGGDDKTLVRTTPADIVRQTPSAEPGVPPAAPAAGPSRDTDRKAR